eukprot:TRINITY_DN4855_c0_g1_i2.p5 TRINITY_DN4855_c0_g1~~TRINITY_DN4855_c0_g1_i2.p5  ORF type:complete len:135 (-),score=10.21 TRINITY_DN4855_c0_g1_i2:220-624(-)
MPSNAATHQNTLLGIYPAMYNCVRTAMLLATPIAQMMDAPISCFETKYDNSKVLPSSAVKQPIQDKTANSCAYPKDMFRKFLTIYGRSKNKNGTVATSTIAAVKQPHYFRNYPELPFPVFVVAAFDSTALRRCL